MATKPATATNSREDHETDHSLNVILEALVATATLLRATTALKPGRMRLFGIAVRPG